MLGILQRIYARVGFCVLPGTTSQPLATSYERL